MANLSSPTGVLLFGSRVERLSKESLDEIKKDKSSRQWILDTLDGLSDHVDGLAEALPKIKDVIGAGKQSLVELESWLKNDDQEQGIESLPGMVFAPAIVLAQMVQYRRFLRLNQANAKDGQASLVAQGKTSALGFCMGVFGAYAVASAKNQAELDSYGSVAVRLACLAGALADAQDRLNSPKSYAVAWRNAKQKEETERIVKGLAPEAWMAVLYDEGRAVVTTSERAAARLVRQLRAAGIIAAEVAFGGEMHHEGSREAEADVDALIAFCDASPQLRFPDAHHLVLPTYSNDGDALPISPVAGPLHAVALRLVFLHRCEWHRTFTQVKQARLDPTHDLAVAFGPDRCVPPTLLPSLESRLVYLADVDFEQPQPQSQPSQPPPPYDDHDAIAVVGMSIKVAGADDLYDFSRMLQTGESQHQAVPPERIPFDSLFREEDPTRQWYANLLDDVDAFDNKFFKRSPRECQAMDPQQRLLMQAAYHAVEQAGYFTDDVRSHPGPGRDRKHVGVYIGTAGVDYEHNIATHSTNAFTATGILRSVLAGRVAHYFGWTGPAMMLDTACSSSALAVHTACRDLLSGECNAALASGAAVSTNTWWFENLAAANFLSRTGQCKPFDEKADGFCRADGIACVFLKRMSDAVADGNPILGCIKSSAVYQNMNITPMFAPNPPSLAQLFKDVIRRANLDPSQVTLVEAHGTGTAVGDPAEYAAIREVLGGPGIRSKALRLGSVKGHIGHTEGASGLVSLIKVLTMMRENYIPPQASFTKMNPLIGASPSDMIEIATSLRPWDDVERKVALINNYGVSGSNAAMVVSEPPASFTSRVHGEQGPRLPFLISGIDLRSIKEYATKLLSFLESQTKPGTGLPFTLADLSFGLDRHSNPGLSQSLIFSSQSMPELKTKLSSIASATASSKPSELGIEGTKPERPVILCFGGQVSTFVGLDRELYDSVAVLRYHLDQCDAIIQSQPFGLGSMYPDIFSRTPFNDPVRLQTMLFAIQYATAKSWIDCGLSGKIAAVVGHSFGELTALCISGTLSLEDAIKLVGRRAQIVRESWGSDRGAMMAIEADESLVQELLTESSGHLQSQSDSVDHAPATIACYNGPRSFTLAGSTKAIDAVADTLAKNDRYSAIKKKRLNVTNAFHSSLVDPLLESLEQVGKDLTFQKPSISLERATEARFSGAPSSKVVADHMRKPVFFNHAVQRLAKEHPSAIFLEAGSNSTITVMASRALMGQTASSIAHHFQAVNITNGGGVNGLTDATVALWKQGLRVSFWAHQAQQTKEYAPLLLPPYQFEKTRHWLEIKSSTEAVEKAAAKLAGNPQPKGQEEAQKTNGLFTFVGYQDRNSSPRFRINTETDKYKSLVNGHVIAQTAPICPGSLQIDISIEALYSIRPDWKDAGLLPVTHDLVIHSALCLIPSRVVWLDYKALDAEETQWEWKLSSSLSDGTQTQHHSQGRLHIRSPEDEAFVSEFSRFERLVNFTSSAALLAAAGRDEGDVDVLQGRNIYRAFSEVVDYSEIYRGVRTMVGRADECAARVRCRHTGETWLDPLMVDNFIHVSGMWVNLMTDLKPRDMYISTGCEMVMRSPHGIEQPGKTQENWHVYGRSTRQSDKTFLCDIFVFDASNGRLVEVILGIQFTQVSKMSMSKLLTKLTGETSASRPQRIAETTATALPSKSSVTATGSNLKRTPEKRSKKTNVTTSKRPDITDQVRKIVATVSGMAVDEVKPDSQLADIGIDSLMGMELCREFDLVFKCTVDQAQLLQATSVREAVEMISKFASLPESDDSKEDDSKEDDSEEEEVEVATTAPSQTFSGGEEVRKIVATVSGMPVDDVKPDTELADIGVDSLMGMELCREIELFFNCSVDQAKLLETTNVGQIIDFVTSLVGGSEFATATPTTNQAFSSDESEDDNDSWHELTPPSRGSAISEAENITPHVDIDAELAAADILESFGEVKLRTDQALFDSHLDNTVGPITAATSRLCVALIVEGLEKLGCSLGAAKAGDKVDRVPHLPKHESFMKWIYGFLVNEARLLNVDAATGQLTRTRIAVPSSSSDAIHAELIKAYPSWHMASNLTYHAGKSLADVLSGATDGIRVLFGSAKSRDLVAALYRDHPFNIVLNEQMRDLLRRITEKVPAGQRLKILEMGAGTGSTTVVLASFLASLGIAVEYTFTDIAPSVVAVARKTLGKQYPFIKFAVHDIEKPPAEELHGQHIILASNAVHATPNLIESTTNIHKALRPDGFLMLLEQTDCMPFINIIFGLIESSWHYTDGRTHAIVPAEQWERDLRTSGFGHVDWTDGHLQENNTERIIIALASGQPRERLPIPESPSKQQTARDIATVEATAERYVTQYTAGWASKQLKEKEQPTRANCDDGVVIVTGATGSLGSHLVAAFAENAKVTTVVCINRRRSTPVKERQLEAFSKSGISLSPEALSKLRILETDTSRPRLGLEAAEYDWLAQHGTHIVHNAWPMSWTRPLVAYEPQLQTMRNLLDLARDMALRDNARAPVGFQLISSIGVVGKTDMKLVPEDRVPIAATLPAGYPEAKWVCERMLDETLHKYPGLFRPMVTRMGQIAGSTSSGYWNPIEHFAFLVKSSQALAAFPAFKGRMQWIPVDEAAAALAELLYVGREAEAPEERQAVYHIDNTNGQPWEEMVSVLADALGVALVPVREWLRRLKLSPLSPAENPAINLIGFFENDFERMSCGDLVLDTAKAQKHSETMAKLGPVSAEAARRYVKAWKEMGFLSA